MGASGPIAGSLSRGGLRHGALMGASGPIAGSLSRGGASHGA